MYEDKDYVEWADEQAIHLIAWDQKFSISSPEKDLLEAVRGGKKVRVIERYPMFTVEEAEKNWNDAKPVYERLKLTGVPTAIFLAPDGETVLEQGSGNAKVGEGDIYTAKGSRLLYESIARKFHPGPFLKRSEWRYVRALLASAVDAQTMGDAATAVAGVVAARRAASPSCPAPLDKRIGEIESALQLLKSARAAAAGKIADEDARAAALRRIQIEFADLPRGK